MTFGEVIESAHTSSQHPTLALRAAFIAFFLIQKEHQYVLLLHLLFSLFLFCNKEDSLIVRS